MNYFIRILILVSLQGCMQANDSLNPVGSVNEARKIADNRFTANAKALNLELSQVPKPIVAIREKDFVFTYEDKKSGKSIIVIVGKDGGVSDTYK